MPSAKVARRVVAATAAIAELVILADGAGGLIGGCRERSARRPTPAPSAASASPRVNREDCGELRSEGPRVVVLPCGDLTIKVMKPTTVTWERFTEQMLPSGWTTSTLDVAGQPIPALILARGSDARVGIAAPSRVKAEVAFVSCYVDDGKGGVDACRAFLSRFLAPDVPLWIEFAAPSLTVGGHTLTVPPGCSQVPDDTKIRCVHGELHWRDPAQKCQSVAESRKGFTSLFRHGDIVSRSEQPCLIFGERSTCDKFTVRNLRPAKHVILRFGGCERPVVQCTINDSAPTGSFPPPCDQVFKAL